METKEKIEQVLEEQVRPYLETHGGGIELVKYEGGKVYIKMFGGCQGCASSSLTLREGIETILKEEFPEIEQLVDLTDHEAGERPYL
ncbi:MAG: NifU family protein [Bacteriovoracales bacterium]|nr:NifU family protein [Bacteriovoracales bacterium]